MKILVTGARGFVGKNLCAALHAIKDGKRKVDGVTVTEIFEYDICSTPDELYDFCAKADFVFHLAGVNRTENSADFMAVNAGLTDKLISALEKCGNRCPIMLSSSIQASLEGRFIGSEYGKSKLESEKIVFDHAEKTGAPVYVYRLANLFGKWCRPNYNSVVATFCHNIANDLPIRIDDRETKLELIYIDDLINELLRALKGEANKNGEFCAAPTTHKTTLGELADMIYKFAEYPKTLVIPEIPEGSLEKKLYSTYVSYLPSDKVCVPLKMNQDERGSFTELIKTANCGQISVNISKPGVTKGNHWHDTKWEFFMVVSGRGLIKMKSLDSDLVHCYEVSGERLEAVYMPPGYTHSITNLSDSEDLVTVMWANEPFNPERPDTYFEKVNE